MKPFFITATGTGIGKTLVTSSLCYQLRQQGKTVTALKPVISGYNAVDMDNDSGTILKSCGIIPTPHLMETISLWRYAAALAPNMAAEREGNPVDLAALVQFCMEHMDVQSDILLVEGVGGIMVPLNNEHTVLDWMVALQWPVILVAGTYLGSISHTLTCIEVLKQRGLNIHCIILSESYDNSVSLVDTSKTLEKFIPESMLLIKIPRMDRSEDLWKTTPSIDWVCE